jgi:hypothetical protein
MREEGEMHMREEGEVRMREEGRDTYEGGGGEMHMRDGAYL